MKRLDYGLRQFSNTLSLYSDENEASGYTAMPLYIDSDTFGSNGQSIQDQEFSELQEQGWEIL